MKNLKGLIFIMKRVFSMLFVAVLAIGAVVAFANTSFALSNADYKKLMAESAAFRAAEKSLEIVWKHANEVLNADKLNELKADQRHWIASGRDVEARQLISEGHSFANAYGRATVNRAKTINGLLSFAETHGQTKGDNNAGVRDEGLADAEYKKLLAESEEFRQNERILKDTWYKAKQNMSASAFRQLEVEQRDWLRHGRDTTAKSYMNSGYSKAEAYAEATFARIRYINNKMGEDAENFSDVVGTYQREGMSASEFIEVRWADRANGILHIELCQNDPRYGKVQVSFMEGRLKGNTAIVHDTADQNMSAKLVFGGTSGLVVTTNNSFKRMTQHLPARPSFDGGYGRG